MRYISKFKTPFINSGAIQVLTLNTSVISFCRFHLWKVVELPLLSSSSKDESKSLTITRKALSWSLFMRAFTLRLRNIHTTGQYEKSQITKEFIITLFCTWLKSRQRINFLTWLLWLFWLLCSVSVYLIPKSFSHLLLEIQ